MSETTDAQLDDLLTRETDDYDADEEADVRADLEDDDCGDY